MDEKRVRLSMQAEQVRKAWELRGMQDAPSHRKKTPHSLRASGGKEAAQAVKSLRVCLPHLHPSCHTNGKTRPDKPGAF